MKKIILSFIICSIILPVYSAPQVKIYPNKVTQGEQFYIEITEYNKDNTPIYVQLNNHIFNMVKKGSIYKSYIAVSPELKEGNYPVRVIDQNHNTIVEAKLSVNKGKFSTQNISFYTPKLSKQQQEKIKEEDDLVERAKEVFSDKQLWTTPFMLPVPHRVSSLYGIKRLLNGKYNGYHTGVDFASPMSYPVKAINNANVVLARYFSKYNSNGNLVFLDHGAGVGSVYLHLSKIIVKEGQYIKKGQVIGYIGSSGRSTGPHIHWGVYLNGQNTDGLGWINFSKKLL